MDETSPSPTGQPGSRGAGAAVRAALPSLGAEMLVSLTTMLVVVGLGAPLGLLWSAYSPRASMMMSPDGPFYYLETEAFAGADGRFTLLAGVAGFVVAVMCWLLLRRYRGPLMMLALALGSAGGSWVAGWAGARVGQGDYEYLLDHAATGWTFPIPLELDAKGALAVQPLVAVLVYTVMAGCSRYPGLHSARLAAFWGRPAEAAGEPPQPTTEPVPLSLPPAATPNALPPGETPPAPVRPAVLAPPGDGTEPPRPTTQVPGDQWPTGDWAASAPASAPVLGAPPPPAAGQVDGPPPEAGPSQWPESPGRVRR